MISYINILVSGLQSCADRGRLYKFILWPSDLSKVNPRLLQISTTHILPQTLHSNKLQGWWRSPQEPNYYSEQAEPKIKPVRKKPENTSLHGIMESSCYGCWVKNMYRALCATHCMAHLLWSEPSAFQNPLYKMEAPSFLKMFFKKWKKSFQTMHNSSSLHYLPGTHACHFVSLSQARKTE